MTENEKKISEIIILLAEHVCNSSGSDFSLEYLRNLRVALCRIAVKTSDESLRDSSQVLGAKIYDIIAGTK